MELTFEEFRELNARKFGKTPIIVDLSEAEVEKIRKEAKKISEKIKKHNEKMLLSEERSNSFKMRLR